MNLQTTFRLPAALATLVAAAAIAVAACGGGGSGVGGGGGGCARALAYGGGGGGGGNCVKASPTPTAAAVAAVGILLSGENPVPVAGHGSVLGYFNGTTSSGANGSGLVNLTANTSLQFHNIESGGTPHTASFLGAYTGTYPGSFTNTNGTTASPAGTSISTANFSSGTVNAGAVSAVYSSGGPGMLIFGCAFHYTNGTPGSMQTVIVVM